MFWVHVGLAIFFSLLIIPTVLLWKDSILWLGFLSIYAVVEMHVDLALSARTNKRVKDAAE